MGFGHRVYKNYDPRAKIMQKTCHEVLDELGIKDDPLLDVAMELERIALHDDYFIEKKLYPNIDFYSGITLKAMGFPTTHVHRAVRGRAHGRLDRAVEGNDRGPEAEDRPPAPALHRRDAARLRADLAAEVVASGYGCKGRLQAAFVAAHRHSVWNVLCRLGAVIGPRAHRRRPR